MDRLKVTPQKLKTEAENFKKAATDTRSVTNDMFATIKEMNGSVWSGDAQKAYERRFAQLKNDCDEVYKMIKEFSDDLIAIANNYDKSERENENAVKSLSINPII